MVLQSQGNGLPAEWIATYETLEFTVEALDANQDDEELCRLGARLAAQLRDWEAIEDDRRRLRGLAIRSSARVQVADALLDQRLVAFAHDLLAEVGNDTGRPLYQRFFTDPHDEVVSMGLDSEVPVVTLIVHLLDQDEALPGKLRAHREPLRQALQMGNGALAARSDALADLGRHGARIEAWLEGARNARWYVHDRLCDLATRRELPSPWVQRFFPAAEGDCDCGCGCGA